MKYQTRIFGATIWGILALLTSLTGAATAAPVTYAFTGLVNNDPFGVGLASFSGTYTFDSAAVDLVADSQTGSYTSSGVAFGIAVDFDGGAVSVDLYGLPTVLNIGVADNFAGPVDQYAVTGLAGSVELGLFFEDTLASAFSSDGLPVPAPLLAAFSFRQFRWFDTDAGNPHEILGNIESLSCVAGCDSVPVPEPGSLWLAGLALSAGALATRRRRRND